MPVKGSDLRAAIAKANIDNLKNVVVSYTAKAYVYPSTHTASVDAIYSRQAYEANGRIGFLPILMIQQDTIIDPFDLSVIAPAKGDQATFSANDFIVEEVNIGDDDMYRLLLRVKNA